MWKKCRIINKSPHLLFETSEQVANFSYFNFSRETRDSKPFLGGKIKTKFFLLDFYLSYISGYAEDVLGLRKIIKKSKNLGKFLLRFKKVNFSFLDSPISRQETRNQKKTRTRISRTRCNPQQQGNPKKCQNFNCQQTQKSYSITS